MLLSNVSNPVCIWSSSQLELIKWEKTKIWVICLAQSQFWHLGASMLLKIHWICICKIMNTLEEFLNLFIYLFYTSYMVYCLFWMITNGRFSINGNKVTRLENRCIPSYFLLLLKFVYLFLYMLLPFSCLSYNIQEYSNKFNGIRKELARKEVRLQSKECLYLDPYISEAKV